MTTTRRRGFALLELLVALAIFAVIAAIAYRGIASVTQARAAIDEKSTRLKALQLAVAVLERDLRHVAARPIRGRYGETLPALGGRRNGLELTAFGFGSAFNESRSVLDRIAYAYADGELERLSFPALDRAPQTIATHRPLLDAVAGLRLRYLDPTDRWLDEWPPADRSGDPTRLPRAVEFTLDLEDYGEVRRVVELPEATSTGALP